MSERGKVNYDAYRKMAGRPGVSAGPLPEYGELPLAIQYAWDNGADAVEEWLAALPADEDAPGSEPEPRYALVEQMGYRQVAGTVRETEFCGRPMLEVTALDGSGTRLVSPDGLYQVTWLTREQAGRAAGLHRPAIAAPARDAWAGSGYDDEDGESAREDGDYDDCEPTL